MARLHDLPFEILDMIIRQAMISRGITRALRLKLVCKWFSYSVNRTLFYTNLLERRLKPFRRWDSHECSHGADKLWHDYFVLRCRDKGDDSVTRFVAIRETVDFVLPHILHDAEERNDGVGVPDWDEVLEKVCWLAVGCTDAGNRMHYHGGRWQAPSWWEGPWRPPHFHPDTAISPSYPWLMMLSAATYLGHTLLVKKFLGKGHDPTRRDDLFPSPMFIAAWTGQSEMLKLFQEHLPEFEEYQDPTGAYMCASRTWKSKIGPGSLHGAAIRGDMDMVRLCLYPPSRAAASEAEGQDRLEAQALILGHKPGSIPHQSDVGKYIESAVELARSPEVYDYLRTLLDKAEPIATSSSYIPPMPPPPDMLTRHLSAMVKTGDISMVRHLLDLGTHARLKKNRWSDKPLVQAIKRRDYGIVELLLSRGADPNGRDKSSIPFRTPLLAAIGTGSIAMVRRIMEAGAEARFLDDHEQALRCALQLEHTEMVGFLWEKGIGLDPISLACGLWRAEKKGLESMAELLRAKGAKLTPWVSPETEWVPPPCVTTCSRMPYTSGSCERQTVNCLWTTPEPHKRLSLRFSELRW
ncbi:ankyrin repeat-containing domain protein [Podospora aff. communis PSN243]|uniref:Ankyrin repeat-containing domain protein n=1 Tax=Podospora aff. communis PSN243 TaxID=3040156 RepID=A0AAV9GM48_9PEZI|nr:ankyrin repeat-containing domain protein [Podospora aff. communis PSN243]